MLKDFPAGWNFLILEETVTPQNEDLPLNTGCKCVGVILGLTEGVMKAHGMWDGIFLFPLRTVVVSFMHTLDSSAKYRTLPL